MAAKRILFIGGKETFLVRVLVKKLQDAGLETQFCPWTVNDINAAWLNIALVVIYMDDGEQPGEEVLHFLTDKTSDEEVKVITIGTPDSNTYVWDRLHPEVKYRNFLRPIDNEEFMQSVNDLFKKVEEGEFRKTILVVDDDPNYLALVREWLKENYKVAMVNSGLQAIKWLGKNKADLILLDHEMPVTTGPQVLEMLRSDEETRKIPVMFLTGKSDKESVMAVVALKPEGYFLKTIGREELLEKLKEFFILHK